MSKLLDQIISLESYRAILIELQQIDKAQTKLLETALLSATAETHQGLRESQNNKDRLRYWLYREAVEIKAHTSSYLSYSEMMAIREANLWKFAVTSTSQFFDDVFDKIETYFATKKDQIFADCDDTSWYSGLAESSKRILEPINILKTSLEKPLEGIGIELPKGEIVDTKSTVEALFERHLHPENVQRDIASILHRASDQFTENWKKQIQSQAPDLTNLKAFASQSALIAAPVIAFHFGVPEQAFAMGIAGGVAGVFGLAAGGHTLTYALINVFPPIAIFSAVTAVGLAIFTQNRTLENRRRQIAEAVNQYHRQLLLYIDSYHFEELNGQTIRGTIDEQSRRVVTSTLQQWQTMISGNLRAEPIDC
jgi:hypothetical protein